MWIIFNAKGTGVSIKAVAECLSAALPHGGTSVFFLAACVHVIHFRARTFDTHDTSWIVNKAGISLARESSIAAEIPWCAATWHITVCTQSSHAQGIVTRGEVVCCRAQVWSANGSGFATCVAINNMCTHDAFTQLCFTGLHLHGGGIFALVRIARRPRIAAL
jgi:hypothetical protein